MKRLGVAIGILCAGYVAACGARSEILDRGRHDAATADDEAGTDDSGDDAIDAVASQETGPADVVGGEQPPAPAFRVVSTTPASDATDVNANASVVVRFSADVTAASLGNAVTLSGGPGNISGTLTTAGMTATFRPSSPLPLACTESATVAASATDTVGTRLGAAYRWQFTTADGAWSKQESVSGTAYKDGGETGSGFNRVGIAADGSAFISWSAYDTSVQHLYLHGSRYAPGSGWTPHLQFGEILQRGIYGGGNLMQAVSANGEAMFLWDGPVIGDAGTAVHRLEWLHYGTDWDSTPGTLASDAFPTATGADASGNFFAVWITPATGTATRSVRMARYAHGTGWGTVQQPSNVYTGSGTVSPQSASIAVSPDGHAIVAWIDGNTNTGPWWIRVERYVPGSGWGGVEALASGTTQLGSVGVISPAIGSDGTAALVWRQVGASASVYKTVVSTFSGTWSNPTSLVAGTSSTATQTFSSVIGTDGQGTFITVWTQRDNGFTQVYASRLAAKSGTWSTPTLLRGVAMDAGAPTTQETGPQIAMGPTGDAVVAVREYDYSTGLYALAAVTYSPSAGWSAPTQLETDTNAIGPPLMDGCGNATLAWMESSDGSVWSARQVHGSSWTAPARIDTPNLAVTNGLVTDAAGPNGEVMASWTSQQGYYMAAATLR